MNIDPPKDTQIYIIEGIAGAGKNTLHKELMSHLSGKLVYQYPEETLLCGWKHVWIPNISEMRINFMNNLLDYCSEIIEKNPKAVFILERFHLSCVVIGIDLKDIENREDYKMLLDKLQKFKAHVYLPILDEEEIEARASHTERQEEIWGIHLENRLKQRGAASLSELFSADQKHYLKLLEKQDIPYSTVKVEINPPA